MSNDANMTNQTDDPATSDGVGMRSPITAYSDLDPAQTRAAARVFIDRFATVDDDRAREYAQLNPDGVMPAQLHEMHKYASERYPDLLSNALQHPDVAGPTDGFAADERDRLAAQMPPASPSQALTDQGN